MFVTGLSVVGKEDPAVIVYDNDGVKYWNCWIDSTFNVTHYNSIKTISLKKYCLLQVFAWITTVVYVAVALYFVLCYGYAN